MRVPDLEAAIDVFDGNADGGPYWIAVYLRSGRQIIGAVHPFKNQDVVWLDVVNAAGDARPTSISVESIDAVRFMPEGED